jgi:hypothetical protein
MTSEFFSSLVKRPLFVLALCFLFATTHAGSKSNMRGERYCEVIIPKTFSQYAVYNTIGLNSCPQKAWKKVTDVCVKKETKSSRVHLNGPRYWVIDGLHKSTLVNPTTKSICGLSMREAGVLEISPFDLLKSGAPYKQHIVNRQTTWIYKAGKPVYELIDPKGNVYVMQSYSIQKIKQTPDSLARLGSQLKLPKNWQFKTGVLKKSATLKAIDNQATVVQDNFLNTYQLATHDFLR